MNPQHGSESKRTPLQICIHIYTYIYVYFICTYVYIYLYTYSLIYLFIYLQIYTHMITYVYMYIYIYTYDSEACAWIGRSPVFVTASSTRDRPALSSIPCARVRTGLSFSAPFKQ